MVVDRSRRRRRGRHRGAGRDRGGGDGERSLAPEFDGRRHPGALAMKSRMRAVAAAGFVLTAWVLGSCGTTPDTGIRLEIDAALMPSHSLSRVHVRTYDYTDPMRTIDEHDFTISLSATRVPFSM